MSSYEQRSTDELSWTDGPVPAIETVKWPWRLIIQAVVAAIVGPIALVALASTDAAPATVPVFIGVIFYIVTFIESIVRAFSASKAGAALWLFVCIAVDVLMIVYLVQQDAGRELDLEKLLPAAVVFALTLMVAVADGIRSPRRRMMLPLAITLVIAGAYLICLIWFLMLLAEAKN